MKKRKVCAGCKHLNKSEVIDFPVYGCLLTGSVVPHYTRHNEDDILVTTFWRIPTECPLPDSEVLKSTSGVPESDWIII